MVNKEDRIVDHNAPKHDAADVRLDIEGGAGEEQHEHDPDRGERHGEHHHERITQRLVEAGHHHVNQHKSEREAQQQFAEGLLLLLIVAAEHDTELPRHRHITKAFAYVGQDGAHVASADVGRDGDNPLLVFPFDPHRAGARLHTHDVPHDDGLALGVGQRQVENLANVHLFGVLHLNPNRVLFPCLAIVAGARAGEDRLQHVGDLADRQFHVRGLLPVHHDEFLGAPGFAAHLRVGDAVHFLDHLLDPFGQRVSHGQIIAADFDLKFVRIIRAHAQHKETLPGAGSKDHARNILEFAAQSCGNLFAGAVTLGLRLECYPHSGSMRAGRMPAPPADARDHVPGFRDIFLDNRLDHFELRIDHVEPRAHRHFGVDAHFALVRGGHELNAHERDEGQAAAEKQNCPQHNERPVPENKVQDALVAVLHAGEESCA